MAEEKNVYKFEFDISELEGKAKRVQELLDQITKGRAEGKNTAELEQRLMREFEGMEKFAKGAKHAKDETGEFKGKVDELSSGMQIFGGAIGGTLGNLGNFVHMLSTGGKASAAIVAALVSLAAGSAIYKQLARDAREAAMAIESVADAQRKQRDQALTFQERVAQDANKVGIYGGARSLAAEAGAMSVTGIPEQAAIFATLASKLGGLTDEDTQRLLAGYFASGQTASLSGDSKADAETIKKLVEAGGQPGSAKILEGVRRDWVEVTKRRVVPPAPPRMTDRDTRLQVIAREMGLNQAEIKLIERIMSSPVDNVRSDAALEPMFEKDLSTWQWTKFEAGWNKGNQTPEQELENDDFYRFAEANRVRLPGTNLDLAEAVRVAERVMRGSPPGSNPAMRPSTPIIVPVTTNIGTQIGTGGNPLLKPTRTPAPNESFSRRSSE